MVVDPERRRESGRWDTESKTLTMPATPGYTALSKSYTPSLNLDENQIYSLSQALLATSFKNGTAASIYSSHDILGTMGSTLRPIEDSPNQLELEGNLSEQLF